MRRAQLVNLSSEEFKPKADSVLVKVDKRIDEKTTESGIIIPLNIDTSSIDRETSGFVVSVGDDVVGYDVGTFVLWPETDGLDLDFLDGEFLLLRAESIIGSKKT